MGQGGDIKWNIMQPYMTDLGGTGQLQAAG